MRWDACGDLYMWRNRSAFLCHPETGDKIWFNQVHNQSPLFLPQGIANVYLFISIDIPDEKYLGHTCYEHGSEIESEVIQHIQAISWECAVGFQRRSGDLLVPDSLAFQHGRTGFTGDRKMLAYFTA